MRVCCGRYGKGGADHVSPRLVSQAHNPFMTSPATDQPLSPSGGQST